MTNRLTALILAFLMIFVLTSCGEGEEDAPLIDPPDDTQPQLPDDSSPTDDEEDEDIPPPEEKSGSIPIDEDGIVRQIDSSYLTQRGLTVESVFAASSDMLLVFVSELHGGVVSETTYLYTYSLSRDCFTGNSMPVGIIGQYPKMVFDDGSVMVLTLNTETYEFQTMLFIRPSTLSYEEYDISSMEGIRAIDVSANKQMTAVSTYTGMYISDIDFSEIYASYDGLTPEGGDEHLDYLLPFAVEWLPDNSGVVGKLLGWEWVDCPFILYPDGTITDLSQYEYLAPAILGSGGLLLYDYFTLTPSGTVRLPDLTFTSLEIDGLPGDDDPGYISALATAASGEMIALGVSTPSDEIMCSARFYRGSDEIMSFDLVNQGQYPLSFESIGFAPHGKFAVMMTSATVDTAKQIYFAYLT